MASFGFESVFYGLGIDCPPLIHVLGLIASMILMGASGTSKGRV